MKWSRSLNVSGCRSCISSSNSMKAKLRLLSIKVSDLRQILCNVVINFKGIGVTQVCSNLRRQASEYFGYLEHSLPVLFKIRSRERRFNFRSYLGVYLLFKPPTSCTRIALPVAFHADVPGQRRFKVVMMQRVVEHPLRKEQLISE